MIKYIKNKISQLDEHTLEVLYKSISSTVVKVIGMIIGVLVSISLGHLIGAEGLGIIGLSNRITSLILVVALLGMPQVIIKEMAIAKSKNNLERIGNIIYTTSIINGVLSILLSTIFILLSPWIANVVFQESNLTYPLIVFIIIIPIQVFSRIFGSGLIAYKKIWQSNLVDQTLSVAITGLLLLFTWFLKIEITVNLIAIFYAIGRIFTMLTVGGYWSKMYRFNGVRSFIPKELLKTALPLLFVSMTLLLASSIDAIMLGWLSNVTQVGYYTVALQLALLTSFFLQVSNSIMMPKIAALYSAKSLAEMKGMIQKVTSLLIVIGVIAVLGFVLIGRPLLSLWGTEFTNAYSILIILSIGQFFNIASGPVGSILMMCNYEKVLRNITFVSLLLNVILNYLLISNFGANGAAMATAITIAVIMIISSYFIKKKLGYLPFKFFSK
ncbi:oligosaccharide flippase family protein [Candidatus Marifrigoribacter sp. Uisw_064]|uniref:oligosaccharide flippase family protein n=1 Tax=Candidatus Marifrigoribacter sp. Uisw_064 TaxID=3230970 RepID=UPI003ABF60CB